MWAIENMSMKFFAKSLSHKEILLIQSEVFMRMTEAQVKH